MVGAVDAATVAVVWLALLAGHWAGDHLAQPGALADVKAEASMRGRVACGLHVVIYTAVQGVVLAAVAAVVDLGLSPGSAAAGLAVSGVSHYVIDRRGVLGAFARIVGSGAYWATEQGRYSMDQSAHRLMIAAAALLAAA